MNGFNGHTTTTTRHITELMMIKWIPFVSMILVLGGQMHSMDGSYDNEG